MERLGNPDMEGLLWKQGNDRLGKWRERYFMLLGRSLFYGPPSRRTQPFGSIPLSICRLRRKPAAEQHQTTDEASSSSSSSASSALMFEIVMTNEDLCDPVLRVYRLRAPNQESYDAWLQILQIHVNAIEE
jgi:hypothetical protein